VTTGLTEHWKYETVFCKGIFVHPDDDYQYIVVTLTPEEERLVERIVNIIYYTTLTFITVLGLVWLAQKPPRK